MVIGLGEISMGLFVEYRCQHTTFVDIIVIFLIHECVDVVNAKYFIYKH